MKCPNCSSDVAADARFCGECGQALKQLGKSLIEEAPSAPPAAAPISGAANIRASDEEFSSSTGASNCV